MLKIVRVWCYAMLFSAAVARSGQIPSSYKEIVKGSRVFLRQERPADAKVKAEQAIKLDSTRYEPFALLPLVAIHGGDTVAATVALRKAQHNPDGSDKRWLLIPPRAASTGRMLPLSSLLDDDTPKPQRSPAGTSSSREALLQAGQPKLAPITNRFCLSGLEDALFSSESNARSPLSK
jgi:hypothetical protein